MTATTADMVDIELTTSTPTPLSNPCASLVTVLHFNKVTKWVDPPKKGPSLMKSSIGGGEAIPPTGSNPQVDTPEASTSDDVELGGVFTSPTTAASADPSTKGKKAILKNVSGKAIPGQVLALMGPSGSGKTTLLNCLSNRGSITSGEITLNGMKLGKRHKRKIAYVQQEDLFFNHLSVRDQLLYNALLRLPGNISFADKVKEVDKMIEMLRLKACQNTPIMLISGGEKKRTNIGTELLTDPQILLLDEPTSGLDSTSAVALIKSLKYLAHEQGKTIITSIHQPSSSSFYSFDSLLLLADGCVIYSGTPAGSLDYFKKVGYPCPDGYNAADHCMDLLVVDSGIDGGANAGEVDGSGSCNGGSTATTAEGGGDSSLVAAIVPKESTRSRLIKIWDNEKDSKMVETELLALRETESYKAGELNVTENTSKWNTTYLQQLNVLIHRCLRNSRSAIFTPLNFIKSVVLGIISGLVWFQMPYTEAYVQDRSGFMFFAQTFWVFDSLFTAMMSFPSERKIIFKERASGSYRLSAYFLAKTISEAPMRLILPLTYIIISYWMAGLSTSVTNFVGFVSVQLLSVLAGESIGLLIGATVMDFEKAMVVGTLSALAMMLTGGFFAENVSSYISWMRFVSPFKYSFHACLAIEFDRDVPCDGSGGLGKLCNGSSTGYADHNAIVKMLGGEHSVAFNVMGLIGIFVIGRVVAYVSLRRVKQDGGRQ